MSRIKLAGYVMLLISKWVQPTFSLQVRLMRFLCGCIKSYVKPFFVGINGSAILGQSGNKMNAKKTAFIVGTGGVPVMLVYGLRNIAQVLNSVIRFIHVAVVNLRHWPMAMHIKPCKAMSLVGASTNHEFQIAFARHCSGNRTGGHSVGASQSRKNSGIGVVVKQLTQALRGKIGLLSLIGQRPASVDSTGRLRYFSGIQAWHA